MAPESSPHGHYRIHPGSPTVQAILEADLTDKIPGDERFAANTLVLSELSILCHKDWILNRLGSASDAMKDQVRRAVVRYVHKNVELHELEFPSDCAFLDD